MFFAADNELQNGRLWNLTDEFQKKASLINLTNKLNYKYGWQNNDELEDTAHDLFLLTYDILCKYEEKNNVTVNSLSELSSETIKFLKNEIVMAYRLKVWNNRSDNAIRMSDIYNIEKGSDKDTSVSHIQSDENIADISTEDIENNNIFREKRDEIILVLTNIFQEDMRNIINKYLFGDDEHGMLTHTELAEENNRCRSAVTRRINRGFKKLSDFIKQYNIKLNQILYPTAQDMKYILSCTKKYTLQMKKKASNKSNNKKVAEIIHISSIQKKKHTLLPDYKVTVHSIEEYLYA